MIPRSRRILAVCGLLAAIVAPIGASGDEPRRPISEMDLFRFAWASDPQVAADGSRVAFVRVSADRDKDDYETSIWAVSASGGEPRRLTNGPRDTWPRWSPDGSRLLFLRRGEGDGKPKPTQVCLLPLDGGEPRPLTDLPEGASAPAWSPDGKAIAFLSGTTPDDLAKLARARARAGPPERESDVRVITRADYRQDNAGYRDFKHPAHIWLVAPPASIDEKPTPKRLTSGPFEESDPTWSPDGKTVYFVSDRDPEPYYRLDRGALYAVPTEGGAVECVAAIKGAISAPSPAPDGRKVAFRGVLTDPVRSYTPPDLFVVDRLAKSPPRNLTADFDHDVGGGLTGDQHPPRASAPSRPAWSGDGSTLVDKVARKGRANLESFDPTSGKATPLTTGDRDVSTFAGSPDGSKIAYLSLTPTTLGDLYLAGTAADGGPPRKLTDLNARLFDGLDLPPPEEIRYPGLDGLEINAWVQKPPGFDPSKTYPLILNIHGGPHAAYGTTFSHEFHWMAAKGYVVLYPNPRGSSSYGAEFGNVIQHRYPGDDHKDLMLGVDELIRRGYVDPKRLGITGGSGGGILTNWAITQTDRFAAAVAQRSIADWSAWWYTSDITLFHPSWFKDTPSRDPLGYTARSPITFVDKVTTPLMLIEGESDLRTPPGAGGEAMFRALKARKKPTVMVRFPGESHELSRSGKPWHRVERLQHIVNWFDKYLMGKPMRQYDVPGSEDKAGPNRPG